MAERWQQWMPFHIDRFRGSPDVQAMHPTARCGYLYLLASAWQTDDCTLPIDPVDLAALSGLGDDLWAIYAPRILRKFTIAGQRLVNDVLKGEWNDAKAIFEHNRSVRSAAGKIGNEKRWGRKCDDSDRKRDGSVSQMNRTAIAQPSQNIATGTTTGTGTEKKQQPSRGAAASSQPDERHAGFRAAVMSYAAYKHVTLAWDGSEAKALDSLLKSAPGLTLAEFQKCLNNRARSPGIPHGERPRLWLPHILKYQTGPLNEFNKTEENSNGNKQAQRSTKSGQTIDAGREFLKKQARLYGLSEAGDSPPSAPALGG